MVESAIKEKIRMNIPRLVSGHRTGNIVLKAMILMA